MFIYCPLFVIFHFLATLSWKTDIIFLLIFFVFAVASSSPGTSLKKSTPHTMSTLHEEQHSESDDGDDAKSDDPATPEQQQNVVTQNGATQNVAKQEHENELEASQVGFFVVKYFHFLFRLSSTFFCVGRVSCWTHKNETPFSHFYFKSFYCTIFCVAIKWQWRDFEQVIFVNFFFWTVSFCCYIFAIADW